MDPVLIKPSWSTELLDPATGVLVVVAAAGDEIEVSERPVFAADGSMSREYRGVGTTEGVAVVQLASTGLPYRTATVYRIVRDTAGPPIRPWTVTGEAPGRTPVIGYARGEPPEPGRTAAGDAAQRLLGEIGLPPGEVEVTAQWVGDVPSRGPGQAAVVTVGLPSGALAVAGQWLTPTQDDGSALSGDCGRAVLPAGPPPSRRVYALLCDVVDDTTGVLMQTSMVVVAPPEVVLVRTYDADGRFLSEHPAQDGVTVTRLPIGAQKVEAVTSGGVSLGRTGILGDTRDLGD
jgi:hypothetical protein